MGDQECQLSMLLIAPLENFAADIKSAAVAPSVRIKRLPGAELSYLWERYHVLDDYREYAATAEGWTHAAFISLEGTLNQLRADPGLQRQLEELVMALRLYKPNQIGINVSWVRPDPPLESLADSGWLRARHIKPLHLPPKYVLRAEEAPGLASLLEQFRRANRTEAYNLALRRLNATYERADPQDRLIDSWIDLETIFASDGKQGDLAYRAALRLAVVLRSSEAERLELFHSMKKSYGIRSQVAHGSSPKHDLRNIASETAEVLRETLRRGLNPDWPETVQAMDALLLSD